MLGPSWAVWGYFCIWSNLKQPNSSAKPIKAVAEILLPGDPAQESQAVQVEREGGEE